MVSVRRARCGLARSSARRATVTALTPRRAPPSASSPGWPLHCSRSHCACHSSAPRGAAIVSTIALVSYYAQWLYLAWLHLPWLFCAGTTRSGLLCLYSLLLGTTRSGSSSGRASSARSRWPLAANRAPPSRRCGAATSTASTTSTRRRHSPLPSRPSGRGPDRPSGRRCSGTGRASLVGAAARSPRAVVTRRAAPKGTVARRTVARGRVATRRRARARAQGRAQGRSSGGPRAREMCAAKG